MTALYTIYISFHYFIRPQFSSVSERPYLPMLLRERVFTKIQQAYFIACLLHVASQPHLFRSLSDVDGAAAVGGARRGVRCGGGRPSPATQTRGVCSASMVAFVCVMENVNVVAQQSMASVPTCSYSKTRSKSSIFSCLLLVVHVVIRRVCLRYL